MAGGGGEQDEEEDLALADHFVRAVTPRSQSRKLEGGGGGGGARRQSVTLLEEKLRHEFSFVELSERSEEPK